MRTPWTTLASLLLIAVLTASCQKMEISGPLAVEKVAFDNAVPLQFGELIAVTSAPGSSVNLLWFVKPDKTIVILGVNPTSSALAKQAITIPRR